MGFISLNLKIRIEAAYEKQQIPFLCPWNPLLLLPDRDLKCYTNVVTVVANKI